MRIRAVSLVAVAAAAAGAVCGAPPARAVEDAPQQAAPRGPTAAEVDRAVERGVRWLLDQQRDDGGFGSVAGETALALWALRHCGVPKDDRALVRAAERLERDLPDGTAYGNGLGICGLLAQDAQKHEERIRKTIAALAKGQCENGQWTYLCGRAGRNVGDNSNTQVAVLGLGAARRHGFSVPDESMRRFLGFCAATQNEDGGWGYSKGQSAGSYGSMTAGILMGWLLATGSIADSDPRTMRLTEEPEAKRALAWLRTRWSGVAENAGAPGAGQRDGQWRYYWLWSLERCADAGAIERIGLHDWYAAGAAWILSKQTDKGHWVESRAVCDTSWALLFLRRGMKRILEPEQPKTPSGPVTPSPDDKAPAPRAK